MPDFVEQLQRRHFVRPGRARTDLEALLHRRDANFEKLIQVGAGDAQESEALENGNRFISCLFQHAPIELEQTEFPVDVLLCRWRYRRVHDPS